MLVSYCRADKILDSCFFILSAQEYYESTRETEFIFYEYVLE